MYRYLCQYRDILYISYRYRIEIEKVTSKLHHWTQQGRILTNQGARFSTNGW